MKAAVKVVIMVSAFLVGTAEYAMAWGGHGGTKGPTGGSYTTGSSNGVHGSVPEPSTLYAIGSGLALLGGAGWYIRRRK